MTDHPVKGLTKDAIEAFERIAVNQPPACRWTIVDKLLDAGLIERGAPDIRRDALGVYEIPNFFVPLPIHFQWCTWCAEQPENSKGPRP